MPPFSPAEYTMEKFLIFAANHWILVSLFVGLVVALLISERLRAGKSLTPQQAVMLLNHEDAIVLDVRDKKDMTEGGIRGAHHIPLSQLKERASELEKFKDKIIIIADKMGQHSGMAVKTLASAGYKNVQRLSGGMVEWRNANLPVSKK
jgi:rhodanese-related sulfurtransferase